MINPRWQGVFPAVTTKFFADERIDAEGTARHIDFQIRNGIHGVVTCGSLGEASTLSLEEKLQVAQIALGAAAGRVPVLANISETSTREALRYVEGANRLGVQGFMLMPSLIYVADRREAMQHVRTVAHAAAAPILLYNNPVAYRVDLGVDAMRDLADCEELVAIKESSGDIRRVTDLRNALADRYQIFMGVDDLAFEGLALGCDGLLAGVGCAFPRETVALYELMKAGRWNEALPLYRWMTPMLHLDVSTKLVQNLKLIDALVGVGSEHVRRPRLPLAGDERAQVERIVREALATRPEAWRSQPLSMASRRIQVIDSHTGGEPTRLVIGGFPSLGHGSMAARRARFAEQFDDWRAAIVLEPRGSDVVVGALLCEPVDRAAAAGVVFFNNEGYLGMCGHGTIGLVASLAHLGRIAAGEHRIETPVGSVNTTLHDDGSVSVRNVPAHRLHRALAVDVPGIGRVSGDVAWGGNWFFLVSEHGLRVAGDNLAALGSYSLAVQRALLEQGHRGSDGAPIDHIELFAEDAQADSRSYVLCPGGAYDRSPCGTGTSAKLACLAADGLLAPGQVWRQRSVIGSEFSAHYDWADGTPGHIVPTIRGRAHVCAEATLIVDDADPFAWGIRR